MLTPNASHLESDPDTVDLQECQIRFSGVCWRLLCRLSIWSCEKIWRMPWVGAPKQKLLLLKMMKMWSILLLCYGGGEASFGGASSSLAANIMSSSWASPWWLAACSSWHVLQKEAVRPGFRSKIQTPGYRAGCCRKLFHKQQIPKYFLTPLNPSTWSEFHWILRTF